MYEDFLSAVESRLPEWCSRREIAEATQLFTARTIANRDSAGSGIGGQLFGKRMLYPRSAVIAWLKTYLEQSGHRAEKSTVGRVLP